MVKKGKAAPQKRKSPPQKAEAPARKKARTQKEEATAEERGSKEEEETPFKAAAVPRQKEEAPIRDEGRRSQKEETPSAAPQMTRRSSSQMNEVAPAPQQKARIQEAPLEERGCQNDDILKAAEALEALRQMRAAFPRVEASHQVRNVQAQEAPHDKTTPQIKPRVQTSGAPGGERGSLQVATFRIAKAPPKADAPPQNGPRTQKEAPREKAGPRAETSKAPEAPGSSHQEKGAPPDKVALKQGEPARLQAPLREERCWDWILVFGNVHYAVDRCSFVEYRPLRRHCTSAVCGHLVLVAGVGTVVLKLPSTPNEGALVRTVTLTNVLHIPSALSNGFSLSAWSQAGGSFVGRKGVSCGRDKQNLPCWFTQRICGLEKLVLDGNPQGTSLLASHGPRLLDLFFTEELLRKINSEAP